MKRRRVKHAHYKDEKYALCMCMSATCMLDEHCACSRVSSDASLAVVLSLASMLCCLHPALSMAWDADGRYIRQCGQKVSRRQQLKHDIQVVLVTCSAWFSWLSSAPRPNLRSSEHFPQDLPTSRADISCLPSTDGFSRHLQPRGFSSNARSANIIAILGSNNSAQ